MKQIFVKAAVLLSIVLFSNSGKTQTISSMKVEQLVKKYQYAKGVMVINFWSTWCKPCIEEIPHFIKTTDSLKNQGVQLLLVSLDAKQVYESGTLKKFLVKKGWKQNTVWLNETDADYYCPAVDSSWSGVIPVTLIVNASKKYSKFYEEPLNQKALSEAVQKAL